MAGVTLFLQTVRQLVDAGSAVLTVGFRKLLTVGVARLGTAATAIVIRRVKLKGRSAVRVPQSFH